MSEVVTLGETMVALYPQEPIPLDAADTLALNIGGAESNLAIGLRRLGHSTRFISRIGVDPFGQRIRIILEQEGVDTEYLIDDPEVQTGIYFREWLADGARRVYYYRAGSAASCMSPADLQPAAFTDARIVHLTGITPALSASCSATVSRAMELARAAGATISFDPNYRARLWDAETAKATLLPLIEQADILLIGHEDAQAVLGEDQHERILEQAVQLGPKMVVLKLAEQGVVTLADGQMIHVPAHPVDQVIDPVGAGDGFNAGFLAGLLRGYAMKDALSLGARVGAAAVESLGDYHGYPQA
ncbi:MAG: sugar kinase [Chloroflexi bacterium AL-W]|nr:sugar kinase [Chloroflexi bacterium AL-N1]NOK68903.1 sugar kinase [Chloroflexi bacterium AL-N10]NOK76886.1 sugar kinase [Chloroflexi bacterium AL-N5]NOK82726.1 sugar kinase [Chloroflexi bacterium AL-W]NOK90743.1 sugar kinase [Chloroflexi bacterium AL-N15]